MHVHEFRVITRKQESEPHESLQKNYLKATVELGDNSCIDLQRRSTIEDGLTSENLNPKNSIIIPQLHQKQT